MARRLLRFWNQVLIITGRNKFAEDKFYCGMTGLSAPEVQLNLSRDGWGKNAMGYAFKGQVLQLRKILDHCYQYHFRLFKDGHWEVHFEWRWDTFPYEHTEERDLRALRKEEITNIRHSLKGDR